MGNHTVGYYHACFCKRISQRFPLNWGIGCGYCTQPRSLFWCHYFHAFFRQSTGYGITQIYNSPGSVSRENCKYFLLFDSIVSTHSQVLCLQFASTHWTCVTTKQILLTVKRHLHLQHQGLKQYRNRGMKQQKLKANSKLFKA